MLQVMRERMQGIIAGTIIVIICVSFALWGVQNYLHGNAENHVVAKVNGVKITTKEIDIIKERLKQRIKLANSPDYIANEVMERTLGTEALQKIIQRESLAQAAKKFGFRIGESQLQHFLLQAPLFQVDGHFSLARFREVLNRLFYTEKDFRRDIEDTMLRTQLEYGIITSGFVLPNEIGLAAKLIEQKRDISYLTLSINSFLPGIKIAAAASENYYKSHQDEFMLPEAVIVQYVQLNATDIATKLPLPTKAELHQFYTENIASYVTVKRRIAYDNNMVLKDWQRQRAQKLFGEQSEKLAELSYTNSDSLEPVAKELGLKIETTSAFSRQGGNLGLTKNPKFVKIAFSDLVLNQGYNSNPIEMAAGKIIVMRLKERFAPKVRSFGEVSPVINAKLAKEAAAKITKETAEKILSDYERGNAQDVAQKYKLTWKSMAAVQRNDKRLAGPLIAAIFTVSPTKINPTVKPSLVNVALANGDYALAVVNKIVDGDENTLSAHDKATLRKNLEMQVGHYEYNLLIDHWLKGAKVKMYSVPAHD